VWHHGRLDKIISTQVLSVLRTASKAVGSARLGFEPSKMGMHSLCSRAAMEMYLAGVPVYTIMLIGKWSSDTFLRYIRKQVEQFSWHIAKQMLTFWLFQTIPEIAPQVVSIKDPRQRNHCDNPRQDKILEATCLDRCKCHLFPVSAKRLMTRGKLMEEASSS
jgi:hypothetical protein